MGVSLPSGTKRSIGSTVTFVEPRHDPTLGALSCETARELVSVAADDELRGADRLRLADHLDGCVECDAYAEQVAQITRQVRLRRIVPEPDFVERVMARSRPPRLGRGGWMRPALAWCGVVIMVQSVRPLVFGELDGAPTHIARHVGAFAVALAVGLVYAALRPHRAFGLLPLVAALLGTTLASTLLDTLSGNRDAFAETVHLAELVGMVLLWMVAGSPGIDRVMPHHRHHQHHRHGDRGHRGHRGRPHGSAPSTT
jgi:predicted anti-sigma-YlaC factor YlaD